MLSTPSIEQLTQIITQITAPAFLLGAVAAFVSVLIGRLNRVIDRSQTLHAIHEDDAARAHLKTDIPRLVRRAQLLNRAILLCTMSAIATSLLVIVSFATAMFHAQHEYGVAILFTVGLMFFTASLINFALEVRIALNELDHQL